MRGTERALGRRRVSGTVCGAPYAARSYGVERASGEPDSVLRSRVRRPDKQVTRAAIVDAVDAILAAWNAEQAVPLVPAPTCRVHEHHNSGPYVADDEVYMLLAKPVNNSSGSKARFPFLIGA